VGLADERAQLAQLADDRTLVERVTGVQADIESTRAQAVNLLGEGHPGAAVVNGAGTNAINALAGAYDAIERFLQEILNAAGGT
jgi:hypothetical protein